MSSINFDKQLRLSLSGSVRESLNITDLMSFKVALPPLNEQEKIANVLSAMDEKIELEKQLLQKYKKQQKALMQLLLTGIVRVVV